MSRFANFTKRLTPEIAMILGPLFGAVFQTGFIGYAMIQANDNKKNSTNLLKKIHDDSANLQKKIHNDSINLLKKIHDDST